MEKLLIFVEPKGEQARKVSMELLGQGQKLRAEGYDVEAVVMGKASDALKREVLPCVSRLTCATDAVLEHYTAEGYAMALANLARSLNPKIILAGATQIARDFMPRVAVILGAGIASDATEIHWKEEPLKVVRPVQGGRALSEISFTAYPAIVTTRPNAFPLEAQAGSPGEFVEKDLGVSATDVKARVVKVEEVTKGKVDVTEADIIVTGGRGMKAPENFALLEELAGLLGGVVGATRSVVDAKWRDQEDQVGKSGKTVSPKLYVAVGLSGAIHHIMGMDTSKVILAINKDSNANIFNYADYGIVGDLFEVLPAITEDIKKRLGK
ncbi:MAG TPA: electron transfer flavoprotein subunit alpha/FixB family protein [Syntrophorhabdales bacterium]|nr:electron transfer flavoprotein subunit alpha/FixB family protein [Syntrophorhabdales bacterium]